MKKYTLLITLFFLAAIPSTLSAAEESTPIGTWRTIDDKTNEENSMVEIWKDSSGHLRGKIIKIYPKPGEDPNPLCTKCEGEKKDLPIVGLEFLWGFSQEEADNPRIWNNGEILDPNDGNIYSCILKVTPDGKKMDVRGYIGFALIGRSQTWIRAR